MQKKAKILITNDDGIHADGIKHLYEAVRDFADVFVVAPNSERSGTGIGITAHLPLDIKEISWLGTKAWSVTGTPADCIKMAVSVILNETPDLILSGINKGSNSGRTVLYSGTVGGVIEGVLRGIPGIAFSSFDMNNTEYTPFLEYVQAIVSYTQNHPLPIGTFLNVNFPSISRLQKQDDTFLINGIKLASQGKQYIIESPENLTETTYRLGYQLASFEERPCSDVHWLNQGYVTAVPIYVEELTNKQFLEKKKQHFEDAVHSFLEQSSSRKST